MGLYLIPSYDYSILVCSITKSGASAEKKTNKYKRKSQYFML
jgi:hypothetical protein